MRSVLRDAIAANRDLKNTALGTLGGGTSSADNNGLELWCIETLVTQLSRDEPAIVQAVLSVLEEAAQDDHCLRTLVSGRQLKRIFAVDNTLAVEVHSLLLRLRGGLRLHSASGSSWQQVGMDKFANYDIASYRRKDGVR